MRVYVVTSSSVALSLKVSVVSGAGLLVLLFRTDDVPAAVRTFLVNLGWLTAFVVVVVLVLTPIWIRKRSRGQLPVGAQIASFSEVLRPDKIDLLLFVVIAGSAFLFPAEDAAYYTALLIAGAIGSGLTALLFRALERHRGVVFLQKTGWAWGFPPLYSDTSTVLPQSRGVGGHDVSADP